AIGREVRERTCAIEAMEARSVRGENSPSLEAELSVQRRELRTCEKELARLGYGIDADDPHRIVGPGTSVRFDDTQFFKKVSFRN
ncbi:MAG TPA: hypothetical protein VK843_14355, partial [Planctomycetota bacterium]|nr:hypothetical protein [Planctomycetota bacterium]